MNFVSIIEKKKYKQALTSEEIHYFITEYVKGNIPDYQVSSLLMAIVLNGLNDREIVDLTMEMAHSGEMIDLSEISGIKVDKHSTGGVGDKTSIALMPMVAACGCKVAKMSGRGLGHTGGTLDKLESIPGFSIGLSKEQFFKQVKDIGVSIIGQTADLVPADKKLYALRDVTGTVDSVGLITSSIMSKKLASGADVICLDVKYGDGAFMKTQEEAINLAKKMIMVGQGCHKQVSCCISGMQQPLGNAIGNALEIKEAIDTLKGKGPADFTELCLTSGEVILNLAGFGTREECRKKLIKCIEDGSALNKLKEMIKAQGGNPEVCDNQDLLPKAYYVTPILSKKSGYVFDLPAKEVGVLSMELGGGREQLTDVIDPAVGIILNKKIGSYVQDGEVLAYVHHNKELPKDFIKRYLDNIKIDDEFVKVPEVIDKVI